MKQGNITFRVSYKINLYYYIHSLLIPICLPLSLCAIHLSLYPSASFPLHLSLPHSTCAGVLPLGLADLGLGDEGVLKVTDGETLLYRTLMNPSSC